LWEGSEIDTSGRIVLKLGYKGMLYVELSAKGPKSDQHSKWAPILANPVWRLCWALASMKNSNERVLVDGFYDEVSDPTERDLTELRDIAFDVAGLKETFGVKTLLTEDNTQDFLKRLFFMPTLNIAGFNGGYSGPGSKTILPHEAVAKVDIRLVPDQDPTRMFELLKRHLDKHGFNDIELRSLNKMDCARSSIESDIVKTTIGSARAVYEKEPMVYPIANGSSPMSAVIRLLGIPSVGVSGISRNDSNVHGPNENIRKQDFINGIKLMATIICSL
jgi:acetylornithine deacetylase/succinyl-diaminopimelate desuccinylase-like protein